MSTPGKVSKSTAPFYHLWELGFCPPVTQSQLKLSILCSAVFPRLQGWPHGSQLGIFLTAAGLVPNKHTQCLVIWNAEPLELPSESLGLWTSESTGDKWSRWRALPQGSPPLSWRNRSVIAAILLPRFSVCYGDGILGTSLFLAPEYSDGLLLGDSCVPTTPWPKRSKHGSSRLLVISWDRAWRASHTYPVLLVWVPV